MNTTYQNQPGTAKALPARSSLDALRTQTLILAHSVRPEWAAMIAALAFGGDAHG